jgi:hypothetical protein
LSWLAVVVVLLPQLILQAVEAAVLAVCLLQLDML